MEVDAGAASVFCVLAHVTEVATEVTDRQPVHNGCRFALDVPHTVGMAGVVHLTAPDRAPRTRSPRDGPYRLAHVDVVCEVSVTLTSVHHSPTVTRFGQAGQVVSIAMTVTHLKHIQHHEGLH